MPLFRKSNTGDTISLTDTQLKALHRCRILIIKNFDAWPLVQKLQDVSL